MVKEETRKEVETRILQSKLRAYGELLTKERIYRFALDEMTAALANHPDDPKKAAYSCGIRALDEYHPAEQQLVIEMTTAEMVLQDIEREKTYLGIDGFLHGLSEEEYQVIDALYFRGLSLREAALLLNWSKSTVSNREKEVFSNL